MTGCPPSLKVLFVLRHTGHFRFFDGVVRRLGANGHSISILFDSNRRPQLSAKGSDRAVSACLAEVPGFSLDWTLQRGDRWRRPLNLARELISYSSYLRPGRQTSQKISRRYANVLPRAAQQVVRYRVSQWTLLSTPAQWALRQVERLAPPDGEIARWLDENRPDVLVASPYIMARGIEPEYVKAAIRVGIPTVAAITSWDHLTTKGVFQIIPDVTLVWNENQIEEAIRLHGVPRQKILATGAAVFDEWFEMRPQADRATFCRQAGLDPDRPFFLYLCSSKSIAPDEADFVEEFAASLRENPETCRAQVLVRPHPLNAAIWRDYPAERLRVWPPDGEIPDTSQARQDYFHALHFSAGAVGINTSAFIEAAIADRPCFTILARRFHDTQGGIAHFQHLVKADFLESASEAAGAAEIAGAILRGRDARRDNRRRFVREFVRPCGIERPASQVMARVIEALAQQRPLEEVRSLLAGSAQPPAHPVFELGATAPLG